jgi:hypothetical protein
MKPEAHEVTDGPVEAVSSSIPPAGGNDRLDAISLL